MPLYILTCHDKANALDLRMATREAHLAWAAEHKTGALKLGGPLLTEDDAMAGSFFIVEADSKAEVEAFNRSDPYTKAGLWDRVEVSRFRAVIGPQL
jgi:uncharacterized protein YciI